MSLLDGITVVAVEQAVAAPLASRHLADLGARVIKIERPGVGDFARAYDSTVNGLSSTFVWLNRSKESLTLDLKRPEAAHILERLLARADVFLHNLAPGAMGRLGFGADRLRETYPRLIICEISGYGPSGPYRDKKAYDLLIQSEVGLLSITGTEDVPCKAGISVADIAAGMYAFSGVLAALFARERTGSGRCLNVSMFEALGEWMGYPAYYASYGGAPPPRSDARHAIIAPYGPYPTSDGRTVFLGVQNEREWVRFCEHVLQQPELLRDPRFTSNTLRVEHRAALDATIALLLGSLTAEALIARLEAAQIANARMNTVQQFVEHTQLEARDRWRTIGSPVGPLRALLPPFNLDGVDVAMRPVPAIGEHTTTILNELGFEDAMVAAWRQAAIV